MECSRTKGWSGAPGRRCRARGGSPCGPPHERVEVLDGPRWGWIAVWPPSGPPIAQGCRGRRGRARHVVRALAEGRPDRVDGRQVEDVEAELRTYGRRSMTSPRVPGGRGSATWTGEEFVPAEKRAWTGSTMMPSAGSKVVTWSRLGWRRIRTSRSSSSAPRAALLSRIRAAQRSSSSASSVEPSAAARRTAPIDEVRADPEVDRDVPPASRRLTNSMPT